MDNSENLTLENVRFSLTPEHECSYLENRTAITLFVSPDYPVVMQEYAALAKLGFRRSGSHVYRPHCSDCGLCIPVRLQVDKFKPSRSQRRNKALNKDITFNVMDAVFKHEHYALYRRYMQTRHAGGGMDNDEQENYEALIKASWSNSKLLEFHLQDKLVMVAVIDSFENGISAVYTFFDPEYSSRGLGVFGILSEIDYVKSLGQEWLYLGYWNPQTKKMSYKVNYQPIEFFDGQDWHLLKT